MDFISASATPIKVTISNKEWTFSILSLRECGDFISDIRKEAREDLLSLIKDGGLSDDGKIAVMKEFQGNPHGMLDLISSIHNPEGVRRVFFKSLQKKHPKITLEQLDEIPVTFTADIIPFCYTILGAKLEPIAEIPDGVDTEPDEFSKLLDGGKQEKKGVKTDPTLVEKEMEN